MHCLGVGYFLVFRDRWDGGGEESIEIVLDESKLYNNVKKKEKENGRCERHRPKKDVI